MRREQEIAKILLVLIDIYSYDLVASELSKLDSRENIGLNSKSEDVSKYKKVASKPSPIRMVQKLKLPRETKAILLDVAKQYENKRFLPTISDVRNFLEIRGAPQKNVIQRPDAFRRVLAVLQETPFETLREIVEEGRLLGPAQLGPISDAIRDANATLRLKPSKADSDTATDS